jgi:hypothetical protein
MRTFTYSDSVAGMQNEKFSKLSELIKHIEDFGHTGEEGSTGIIYDNDEPILMYNSSLDGLFWQNYGE